MSNMKLVKQTLDKLAKLMVSEQQKLLARSVMLSGESNFHGAAACRDKAEGLSQAFAMVVCEMNRR